MTIDGEADTSAKASAPPKTSKQARKTDNGKVSNGSGKKRTANEMDNEESELKEDVVSVKDEADTVNDEI